nr:hypothetical protein [Tanacetum cinerariifolium]
MHEKPDTPRSCLRWKPTGGIFKIADLRWIHTGKMFIDSKTMVDNKPLNGSNEDITNLYECEQTLNFSAGTLNLSAGTSFNPKEERLRDWLLKRLMSKNQVPWGIYKQEQSPNSAQDAPSPSNSQTTPKTQSPIISNDVEEENHDLNVAHMNNDLFFRISIPENDSESSSSDVIPTVVHTAAPNSKHITNWTKDHLLDNIIGELERPISTRLQLREQALFCYYDSFLTSVEPKNNKDTLTQAC